MLNLYNNYTALYSYWFLSIDMLLAQQHNKQIIVLRVLDAILQVSL